MRLEYVRAALKLVTAYSLLLFSALTMLLIGIIWALRRE
jgi:hypothetical protein